MRTFLSCFIIIISISSTILFAQESVSSVMALAQDNSGINNIKPKYNAEKKYDNEIITNGDIVIIPSNKLDEFNKNKEQYSRNNLNKITDITLDGYVTDAMTKQPLEGIKVTATVYREGGGTDVYGPVLTNLLGYYHIDSITGVDDQKNIVTIGQIEYFGGQARITTSSNKKIKLTKYTTNGEQIGDIVEQEIFGTEDLFLDLKDGQRIVTKLEIDGKIYTNTHIKNNGYHYILKDKNIEKLTIEDYKQFNKITAMGAIMDFVDTTQIYHDYVGGGTGVFESNFPHRSIALPKITFLPDSMQFTDPNLEYEITTEIRLWQAMGGIINENDYKSIGTKLMPMKIYLDTLHCPSGWKEELRNGINNIRNRTTTDPDGLVMETPEYKEISFANGFSQFNMSYVDSTVLGQQDFRGTLYYSSSNDAFVGMALEVNTSTNLPPLEVYKIIQREIQVYITGGIHPINSSRYMGTNTRGQPYEPTEPEMNVIDMARNMQNVINENDGARIFINRFLHPGTVITNRTEMLKDRKEELLEQFRNEPGVKIKFIDK